MSKSLTIAEQCRDARHVTSNRGAPIIEAPDPPEIMDRAVADVLRATPERERFIRGKQLALACKRAARFAGTSKYPLRKMVRFASDGMISFSVKPLKLAIMLGILSAAIALLGILWVLGARLLTDNWVVPGWTAIIIATLSLGGIQLLCMGILGEYIGRIYMESEGRPLYVIGEKIGPINAASWSSRAMAILD